MPRYKLTLEYDGTDLSGWQKTPGQPTVQEALEAAVYRFGGEHAEVVGAGRTDAGVHALGQCAHVDLQAEHEPFTVMNALNFHLLVMEENGNAWHNVGVLSAEKVSDEFNARFSARARHYRYRILSRRPPPVLDARFVWHVPEALDATAMQAAADTLLGHHDFTSFRDSKCQSKSPMKTLERFDVHKEGEEICLYVSARSFLHHQVRIMAGTLYQVGRGKWQVEDAAKALAAKDRSAAGPTAPAQGLCLMKVDY